MSIDSRVFSPIDAALEDIRAGRMVVILDDEDRENEGDLIMAASMVRPEDINFMVREARGLVCLTLTEQRTRQLGLRPMVSWRSGCGDERSRGAGMGCTPMAGQRTSRTLSSSILGQCVWMWWKAVTDRA